MAVGNLFGNLMEKARSVYNNFFYDGSEAPSPRKREEYADRQPEAAPAPQAQAASWQYGQAQQYPGYQQPYQQPAQAPAYQQPAQQQAAQQPRNRRAQQHAAQQEENNVVDFGAYQQHSFFGQAQQAPQQPAQEAPAGSLLSARVINARSMADCRSAITLLRNGDAVVIVLENVTEPGEMRRLVDTLSGACYSLTATITKVSRYGVYLLAPQTLAVFADQATNIMNSAPARPAARPQYQQQPYQGQRAAYGQQLQPRAGVYQPQNQQNPYAAQQPNPYAQQPNPYAGQPGFTQRSAQQEETPQDFYQRPAPQAAQAVGFSAQPVGYGYAPDEAAAAEQ